MPTDELACVSIVGALHLSRPRRLLPGELMQAMVERGEAIAQHTRYIGGLVADGDTDRMTHVRQ